MEGVPAGDEGELQSMEHMGAGHEAARWWERCQCLFCDVVAMWGGYEGNAGTAGAAVAWAGIPPARDLSGAFLLATVPLRLKAVCYRLCSSGPSQWRK